jgi:hypothetical protein
VKEKILEIKSKGKVEGKSVLKAKIFSKIHPEAIFFGKQRKRVVEKLISVSFEARLLKRKNIFGISHDICLDKSI